MLRPFRALFLAATIAPVAAACGGKASSDGGAVGSSGAGGSSGASGANGSNGANGSSGGQGSTCEGDLAGPCMVCNGGFASTVPPRCRPGEWMQCPAGSTEVICSGGTLGAACDPTTGAPGCASQAPHCGSKQCTLNQVCVRLGDADGGSDAGSAFSCEPFPGACAVPNVTRAEQCTCLAGHLSPDAGGTTCASYTCDQTSGRPELTCQR